MRILRLSVQGFRGCPDGEYSFADGDAPRPLTVITGPEFSGKTSLLEAIAMAKEAVGSYGFAAPFSSWKCEGREETTLEAVWAVDAEEQRRAELAERTVRTSVRASEGLLVDAPPRVRALFERYAFDANASKIEYFPANRSAGTSIGLKLPRDLGSSHDRLTSSENKYAWVGSFLTGEEQKRALAATRRTSEAGLLLAGELDEFRVSFNARLAPFAPHLRFAGARETSHGIEALFALRSGMQVPLSRLASSERQAVLFVAAALQLGLDNSMLLVDEPELHQHPTAHVRVLNALQALGKNQQLIVATTSASILRSAPSDSVIQLPARSTAQG